MREREDYDELLDGKLDNSPCKQGTSTGVAAPAAVVKVEHKKSRAPAPTPVTAPAATTPVAAPAARHVQPVAASPQKPNPDEKPPAPPAPAAEASLSERLELTAGHPDIAEAVLALVSWCEIVGDSSASSLLFREDCHALEILLQALCASPSSILQPEVHSRLVQLLALVLPVPSLPSGATSTDSAQSALSIVKSLESVLTKVLPPSHLLCSVCLSVCLSVRLCLLYVSIHACMYVCLL